MASARDARWRSPVDHGSGPGKAAPPVAGLHNAGPHFALPAQEQAPPGGHWANLAGQWAQVGTPLRPIGEDLALYQAAIGRWTKRHGVPRALILGVTPELYHLPWPAGTHVLAMDHTQNMIDSVWPGPQEDAICADWTEMPLEAGSRDLVLCDGGIIMLAYPHGHQQLVRALCRVLVPDGLCIFRLYVPPAERESPDTVLGDLLAGRIANLNVLKLRLGMALQESSEKGVQLSHVWNTLHRAAPDFGRLADRIAWPLEHLLAINTYRDSPTRYSFLRLDEVSSLFCDNPGGFTLETIQVPAYELGQRCPHVVFRRNGLD